MRDEDDVAAHLDDIHQNAVRHELVSAPSDWPHSTFGRWVRRGIDTPDWGADPELIGRLRRMVHGCGE